MIKNVISSDFKNEKKSDFGDFKITPKYALNFAITCMTYT